MGTLYVDLVLRGTRPTPRSVWNEGSTLLFYLERGRPPFPRRV